jgi:hypothetical protein
MGLFTPYSFLQQKIVAGAVPAFRTDSNAANLVWAQPGALFTNLGMSNYYDEVAYLIKGSGSAKTPITTNLSQNTTYIKFPSDGYNSSIGFVGREYNTDDSDLEFGSGNFTIEMWINMSDGGISGTANPLFWKYQAGSVPNSELFFDIQNRRLRVAADGGGGESFFQTDELTWNDNQWYHVCLQRNGTSWLITRDGNNPGGGSATINRTLNTTATPAQLLGLATNTYTTKRVQDFRIYKGVAKYGGSTFTPPPSMIFIP